MKTAIVMILAAASVAVPAFARGQDGPQSDEQAYQATLAQECAVSERNEQLREVQQGQWNGWNESQLDRVYEKRVAACVKAHLTDDADADSDLSDEAQPSSPPAIRFTIA